MSVESPVRVESIRAQARNAGFVEAGIVALPYEKIERDSSRFEEWIDKGRAGEMQYLARRNEAGQLVRSRVDLPFPWAKSVVICLAGYQSDAPLSMAAAPEGAGWIARYAWSGKKDERGEIRPSDYHKVLLKRLRALEAGLRAEYGAFESRAYVDTGPIVERSLAQAAGLGWTGKNTCLIHPKLGSWNFLAALITSLPVAGGSTALAVPDRCGSCTRCIDACPTNALVEPYEMDATRCISYLTIEHRGEIAEDLREGIGRQVYGCDICQDVCPWNRKAPITATEDGGLGARRELVNPDLGWLAELDFASYERMFNGSPIRRAGFLGLRRNVAIAMGNSGLRRFLPWLERWRRGDVESESGVRFSGELDPKTDLATVKEAAAWAIHRILRSGDSTVEPDA
jgi:epoxyqueuosine reductase